MAEVKLSESSSAASSAGSESDLSAKLSELSDSELGAVGGAPKTGGETSNKKMAENMEDAVQKLLEKQKK